MRMLNNKGMKVVVLSGNGNGCPRMKITKNTMQIRDDYKGIIKLNGSLLNRIVM
ncbi:MAG: hypothetical protein ACP5MK_03895 [Candidatus Micrarchaeia archaeon]